MNLAAPYPGTELCEQGSATDSVATIGDSPMAFPLRRFDCVLLCVFSRRQASRLCYPNGWFVKKDKTDLVETDGFQQNALEYPGLSKEEIFESVERFYPDHVREFPALHVGARLRLIRTLLLALLFARTWLSALRLVVAGPLLCVLWRQNRPP